MTLYHCTWTRCIAVLILFTTLVASAQKYDRWIHVSNNSDNSLTYIDRETIQYPAHQNASPKDYVIFWAKFVDTDKSYSLIRFEIRRSTRQIRVLSTTNYNAKGSPKGMSSNLPTEWADITPNSAGEVMMIVVDTVANLPQSKEDK